MSHEQLNYYVNKLLETNNELPEKLREPVANIEKLRPKKKDKHFWQRSK
jgi:hypothetical protein